MPETTLQQALDLAMRHQQAGDVGTAEAIYRQILDHDPKCAPALHLLGVLHAQSGHFDKAKSLISQAIGVDPSRAEFHANLGNVLQESGGGRGELAIAAYRQALALAPDQPEIHNNLGNALRQIGQLPLAIDAYQRALQLRPAFPEAFFNLANAYADSGAFSDAIRAYDQAIRLRPDYYEAWLNLGRTHFKGGDFAAALPANQKAIVLTPSSADAHQNLGQVFQKLGRLDEAVSALSAASELAPNSHAISQDLGNALREAGRLDQAAEAYRRAIAAKPDFADAHYGLAWALLLKGDFRSGLPEYEWRHRLAEAAGAPPFFDKPQWDGSPLNGIAILLQAEQGFGDSLFALRYVPRIVEKGGVVIVRAPSSLSRLLRWQPNVASVIEPGQSIPDLRVQSPMMSLPLLFETTLANLTVSVPYIVPEQRLVDSWRSRIKQSNPQSLPTVGLVWAGGATPPNRSILFPLLGELTDRPRVQFHSLQKGERAADAIGSPLLDWDAQLTDFADTAALIANLDLVITIDTAVAHLAGAMGKPVWVMLQYAADWRWFPDRDDSPWYPTMRLFRQPTPGDWRSVIANVTDALTLQFPDDTDQLR